MEIDTIDPICEEEAREVPVRPPSNLLHVAPYTRKEIHGPKTVREMSLRARIDRCARMLAFHYFCGEEGLDDVMFARQTTYYRIPTLYVGVVVLRIHYFIHKMDTDLEKSNGNTDPS